eukprot:9163498-Ditylum_brightwellii.AAC.1
MTLPGVMSFCVTVGSAIVVCSRFFKTLLKIAWCLYGLKPSLACSSLSHSNKPYWDNDPTKTIQKIYAKANTIILQKRNNPQWVYGGVATFWILINFDHFWEGLVLGCIFTK